MSVCVCVCGFECDGLVSNICNWTWTWTLYVCQKQHVCTFSLRGAHQTRAKSARTQSTSRSFTLKSLARPLVRLLSMLRAVYDVMPHAARSWATVTVSATVAAIVRARTPTTITAVAATRERRRKNDCRHWRTGWLTRIHTMVEKRQGTCVQYSMWIRFVDTWSHFSVQVLWNKNWYERTVLKNQIRTWFFSLLKVEEKKFLQIIRFKAFCCVDCFFFRFLCQKDRISNHSVQYLFSSENLSVANFFPEIEEIN